MKFHERLKAGKNCKNFLKVDINMLFPKNCVAKLNKGIFVGPDLRKLIEYSQFVQNSVVLNEMFGCLL